MSCNTSCDPQSHASLLSNKNKNKTKLKKINKRKRKSKENIRV